MGRGLFGFKRDTISFFVGSYGGDLTRGVYVFQIDRDNGEIFKRKYYKSTANPTYMTRAERFIYTCYKNNTGRDTDGGIWQYAAMDIQFGLTAIVSYEGHSYENCFVTEDRSCLYAADYYNGEVAVVPIKKMKVITVVQTIKHEGKGPHIRQDQSHPTYICSTPDLSKICVTDLGSDEIVFYDILEKGRLQRNDELSFKVKPGNGPKKLIFSKNGQYAYLLNELSNTVEVYLNNDNKLTLLQTVDTFPKQDFDGTSYAGDMIFMDNEEYMFVSNRGHDSVSVFKVDKERGTLTYIEFVDTDENPRALLAFEDKWLVVASQKGGSLESWEIKTHDRHGVLFETNYSYMIAEPVTMLV